MKLRDRVRPLAVVCSLVAACSLAGCGGGNETAPLTPAPAATPAPAPAQTPPPASDTSSAQSTGAESGSTEPANSGDGMPNSGMAESGTSDAAGAAMGGGSASAPSADSSYAGLSLPNLSTLFSSMGSTNSAGPYGNAQRAPVNPAPGEDEDYLTKAKYAFAIGKEAAAEQYFYAQLLARDEDAASLLQQVRWSPGERRPATTVRFAVGVDLKAPTGIEDYRPIGHSQAAGNNAAGGGGSSDPGYAASSGMGQPGGQAGKGEKTLGDLTGRFGEELVKAFETAWDNGDFGTAFKDVEVIRAVQAAPVNNPYGSSSSGMGMSDPYGPSMGAEGMGYGSGAPGIDAGKPADAAPRMRAVPGKAIVPGMLYVGTGSLAELEEKAQQEGIDFLFLFEVSIKTARGIVHNDTRLRLVSTKDGSALGATSTLNNLKVDVAASKKESDDVEKQISNIFRKVDAIKLTDMPKLEPVHAQARIKSLLEKKPASVLQTLMEIKLFHSMGLLDDTESSAAYQLAIGGAGVALAKGTLEDRQFVLDPLLPPYK